MQNNTIKAIRLFNNSFSPALVAMLLFAISANGWTLGLGDIRQPDQGNDADTNSDYSTQSSVAPRAASTLKSQRQWNVRTGETLWSIATIIAKRLDSSVHKTAVALHQYNTGSFLNGNINRLINNTILTIPTAAQINAINLPSAIALLTSDQSAQREAVVQTESKVGKATNSTLNDRLLSLQRQLDKISLENTDVRNQMSALGQQIDNLELIIEINNQEINKLSVDDSNNLPSLKNLGTDQYLLIGTVVLLVILAISIIGFSIYLVYRKFSNPRLERQTTTASQENDGVEQAIADDTTNSVQLELAQAYLDLGDTKGAEQLLMEVIATGNANQRHKAELLLSQNST